MANATQQNARAGRAFRFMAWIQLAQQCALVFKIRLAVVEIEIIFFAQPTQMILHVLNSQLDSLNFIGPVRDPLFLIKPIETYETT